MALIAALLGWMFDGFEIGMFPLAGRPALLELLPDQSQAVRDQWFGVITAVFLIGAASGGVLFGWLGDRIGRVRAMSFSIFTYAIFTGLCEEVSDDLRRKGYAGRTIGIKLRFDDFRTVTRDHTLDEPTDDARVIRREAGRCLARVPLERRIRLLGVRVGHLSPALAR